VVISENYDNPTEIMPQLLYYYQTILYNKISSRKKYNQQS